MARNVFTPHLHRPVLPAGPAVAQLLERVELARIHEVGDDHRPPALSIAPTFMDRVGIEQEASAAWPDQLHDVVIARNILVREAAL